MERRKSVYILVLVVIISCFEITAQGEGGVFTQSRLSALKTGEGSLGNNPQALEWFNELKLKTSVLGTEQKISLDDIEGSVYFDENFIKGTVHYNKVPYEDFYLRYDAYNDEVEIKRYEASQIEALHKSMALSCNIGGDNLVYREFLNEKEELVGGYLFEYYLGSSITVFKRRLKAFKEAKEAKTSLQGSFPHRFIDKETYVVRLKESSNLSEAKNLKKYLFTKLDMAELKTFKILIKKNDTDFKNGASLLNVLRKLDSMM